MTGGRGTTESAGFELNSIIYLAHSVCKAFYLQLLASVDVSFNFTVSLSLSMIKSHCCYQIAGIFSILSTIPNLLSIFSH